MDETITAVKQHQGILNQSRCPEEVKQYVQAIPDGLVCEWLYICALDGMGLEQLKKLNEAPVKESLKKSSIHPEREAEVPGQEILEGSGDPAAGRGAAPEGLRAP